MHRTRALLRASLLLAVVTTPAAAQSTSPATRPATAPAAAVAPAAPMSPKDAMLADVERQRKNVLDYVNVVPDSVLRFRTTKDVRTYAQQIHHIALANVMILSRVFGAAPIAIDTAASAPVVNNKEALRAFVNAAYDHTAQVVRNATPEALAKESTVFGMTRTGARWIDGVLEHGTWTLGQTVPYLRMNGITPPGYLPF